MHGNIRKKGAYPIILIPEEEGYFVKVPDFNASTQGDSIADAMEMARDMIGLLGIDLEDEKNKLPEPYSVQFEAEKEDIVTLVDVDFAEYRKKVDQRAVKKNCTIPYWMSVEADKAGLNYSRVLQDALSKILGISQKVAN